MTKKITAFLAIIAVASFSSFALAGGNCGDKDNKECDRDKSEASAPAVFEVACDGKKDGDRDRA